MLPEDFSGRAPSAGPQGFSGEDPDSHLSSGLAPADQKVDYSGNIIELSNLA